MNKALKAVRMIYANSTKHDWPKDIWDAIEDAMAQPEQEPVAKYIGECSEGSLVQLYEDVKKGEDFYTTPPQRTWVGLTDEEIDGCDWGQSERDHAKAVEAKLKEKNT